MVAFRSKLKYFIFLGGGCSCKKCNKIHTTKLLSHGVTLFHFMCWPLFWPVKCISHFIVHSIKNPFPFVSNPHVSVRPSIHLFRFQPLRAECAESRCRIQLQVVTRTPGLAAKSLIIELKPRVEVGAFCTSATFIHIEKYRSTQDC